MIPVNFVKWEKNIFILKPRFTASINGRTRVAQHSKNSRNKALFQQNIKLHEN